jgi:hypothetical protein
MTAHSEGATRRLNELAHSLTETVEQYQMIFREGLPATNTLEWDHSRRQGDEIKVDRAHKASVVWTQRYQGKAA